MARVYIAEKPSLARAIAAVLPHPLRNHTGYIEAANGEIVSWCFGHLLEQVEPHVYDQRYKVWRLLDLPIIPRKWQLTPRKAAKQQLAVLRKLLKTATEVIHAGDPDREGQLLVDEVISHLRYPIAKRPVRRLLVSDLNPEAVRRALRGMRPNAEFAPLSTSALARSRADWLFGINMTRAYTLLGQRAGYKGVLSVGRVQTPVLGLVVRRDDEIRDFVPKPFFLVHALIPYEGKDIEALWMPSKACAPYQDHEGRVLHRKLAENVALRIKEQPATLTLAEHKENRQSAPLPYSLSALQIDAAKRFGLSASEVLRCCQDLYETHKAITYPRSDCRFLPEGHLSQAQEICNAIGANASACTQAVASADLSIRSKAWDDTKVGAHHAIIPTAKELAPHTLSGNHARVFELIARQYLMQFYPPAIYATGKLVFTIGTGTFMARGQHMLRAGWRTLLGKGDSASSKEGRAHVPVIKPGTVLTCREGRITDKQTEAPKAFTDATLLQAMTGIARFVADLELRKILRDTDGLGTEATRASILEVLFKRMLLTRKDKSIHAAEAGRALIYSLPEAASHPDMTAHWERKLHDIADKNLSYSPFMQDVEEKLAAMLEAPRRGEVPTSLSRLESPKQKAPGRKRARRPRPK